SGKPITLESAQAAYVEGQTLAHQLQEVAQVAVAASHQLNESNKITKSEAFDRAVEHVEKWFAQVVDVELDPLVVANAVEGAYYALTKLQAARTATTGTTPDADIVEKWLREEPKP